jgi:hypothetical protein
VDRNNSSATVYSQGPWSTSGAVSIAPRNPTSTTSSCDEPSMPRRPPLSRHPGPSPSVSASEEHGTHGPGYEPDPPLQYFFACLFLFSCLWQALYCFPLTTTAGMEKGVSPTYTIRVVVYVKLSSDVFWPPGVPILHMLCAIPSTKLAVVHTLLA